MMSLELTRNEIFQSFSNSLGTWWIELDSNLNVVWTNRKFQKALDYDEGLFGESFVRILHSLDLKKLHHGVQKSFENIKVVPFVAKVKDSKKEYRNVKFKVKYSPSNKAYYIVGKEFKRRFDLKLQLEQYSKNLFSVNQNLEKTSFGLMRLQAVLSKNFESFDDQIEALLKFGCDSFGAESATISKVESYSYQIKNKIGFEEGVLKSNYNIKNTVCQETYNKTKIVTCSDVTKDEKKKGLEIIKDTGCISFISAPLKVQEGLLGTVCFYSKNSIDLINNELHFLTILASMLARTISLQRAEQELIDYSKKLEDKNSELDKFAFTVSHDLKSPLRAVKSLVEWIGEDLEDKLEGDIKDNFNLLTGRVDKMERLIYDILQYSRAGTEEVKSEKINVQSVIDEVLLEHQDHSGKRLTIIADNTDKLIINKRVFLYQTLSNLVSNSIKYSDKENVQLKISTAEIGGILKIKIEDNGPGIPHKHRHKVFQVFQTVHGQNRTDSTGIGLSIVKKIVKAMGGSIGVVDSELGGVGFEFSVLIQN